MNMKLDAYWMVGFTDADGSFSVRFTRNTLRCEFVLSQDARSKHVLFAVKSFFGVGNVHKAGGHMWAYSVGNLEALHSVVVPFFDTHPLRTSKYLSWLQFRKTVMDRCSKAGSTTTTAVSNEVTSVDGDHDCLLKKTFPPESAGALNASWLLGFLDGDGCFTVSIVNNYPCPQFLLAVASKDRLVCYQIQTFLGCGLVYARKNGVYVYQISRRKDLINRLFPMLYSSCGKVHLLRTQKRHSASLFCRIVLAIEEGKHLNEEGMLQIHAWKERMRHVGLHKPL